MKGDGGRTMIGALLPVVGRMSLFTDSTDHRHDIFMRSRHAAPSAEWANTGGGAMGAGTILLVAVAVLIAVIMYRTAGGVHGTADAAPVAVRGADAGGKPSAVGPGSGDADGDVRSGHRVRDSSRGC
jgi:hypothetical protein